LREGGQGESILTHIRVLRCRKELTPPNEKNTNLVEGKDSVQIGASPFRRGPRGGWEHDR